MAGAIGTGRLVPGQPPLTFDDLLDDVQQLVLTADDLAALNALNPVTKTLRFTQRKSGGKAAVPYTHLDVYKRQPLAWLSE